MKSSTDNIRIAGRRKVSAATKAAVATSIVGTGVLAAFVAHEYGGKNAAGAATSPASSGSSQYSQGAGGSDQQPSYGQPQYQDPYAGGSQSAPPQYQDPYGGGYAPSPGGQGGYQAPTGGS